MKLQPRQLATHGASVFRKLRPHLTAVGTTKKILHLLPSPTNILHLYFLFIVTIVPLQVQHKFPKSWNALLNDNENRMQLFANSF